MAAETPKRIDTKKQALWIRTLDQWESSGETARAYCVRQGLKETQFHWWKKVLQDRGKWKPEQFRQSFHVLTGAAVGSLCSGRTAGITSCGDFGTAGGCSAK